MTAYDLDFRDKRLFPLFTQLPYDRHYDVGFFTEDLWLGLLRPRHHWCFLVEITEIVRLRVGYTFLPLRPLYYGKDANGNTLFLAFHTDDRSPLIGRDCRVGDTLAIMYAESHVFMDGQIGIRVEWNEQVKLFHCSLERIFSVAASLNVKTCHVCDKPANSQCINCGMKYCSKDCQVKDWKPNHKRDCNIGKSIKQWKSFDWGKFDYCRTP